MKRWAWLLIVAAAAPGCLALPENIEEPPPPPLKAEDLSRPPITADQVDENNPAAAEQRLRDELARAQTDTRPARK
jgi:hypothetical protein